MITLKQINCKKCPNNRIQNPHKFRNKNITCDDCLGKRNLPGSCKRCSNNRNIEPQLFRKENAFCNKCIDRSKGREKVRTKRKFVDTEESNPSSKKRLLTLQKISSELFNELEKEKEGDYCERKEEDFDETEEEMEFEEEEELDEKDLLGNCEEEDRILREFTKTNAELQEKQEKQEEQPICEENNVSYSKLGEEQVISEDECSNQDTCEENVQHKITFQGTDTQKPVVLDEECIPQELTLEYIMSISQKNRKKITIEDDYEEDSEYDQPPIIHRIRVVNSK